MTTREKIPHTARFLLAFHTAGGTRTAPATQEATVTADPFATATAAPAQPEDRRTQPQRELMAKLMDELAGLDPKAAEQAAEYTTQMTLRGRWTPGREGNASAWITRLITKIKETRAAQRAAAPATQEELEDGMYRLDGRIYKVVHAVHGSGRQYAKELLAPAAKGEAASWERAPGVVRKLRPEHKLSLEEAKEYGRIYGVCCRCAAPLTDEDSIAAGIGPVCAGKF